MTRPSNPSPTATSDVDDAAGALHFVSCVEIPVLAKQNHSDLVRIHVECDAEHTAGERHQFIKAHPGKTRHLGDPGGDTADPAHLPRRRFRRESFPHLLYSGKRTVEYALEALRFRRHSFFPAVASPSFSLRSSSTPSSSDAR